MHRATGVPHSASNQGVADQGTAPDGVKGLHEPPLFRPSSMHDGAMEQAMQVAHQGGAERGCRAIAPQL
jgi:hypothetical protein